MATAMVEACGAICRALSQFRADYPAQVRLHPTADPIEVPRRGPVDFSRTTALNLKVHACRVPGWWELPRALQGSAWRCPVLLSGVAHSINEGEISMPTGLFLELMAAPKAIDGSHIASPSGRWVSEAQLVDWARLAMLDRTIVAAAEMLLEAEAAKRPQALERLRVAVQAKHDDLEAEAPYCSVCGGPCRAVDGESHTDAH